MDVVILAGGEIPPELASSTTATERALIEVGGRPTLHRVLESLQDAEFFGRIHVVTTPGALASLPAEVNGLPSGEGLVANLKLGIAAASSPQVLIVTGDVPLVTASTWRQFLEGSRAKGLEAAYPIVSKENVERMFPGSQRTYGPLRDGSFTGGNAFLLPRDKLDHLFALIETAYNARKEPLKLARMLGPGFILSALSRRLTVEKVEQKLSALLGMRSGAVSMQDATISFDIDKPSDLQAANDYLNATHSSSS